MGRTKIWGLLALVLTLLMLASSVAPVFASMQELEQKREDIHRKLDQERSNLKEQRSRKADLEDELAQLDRRLRELQSELAQINGEITATETEIARVEEKIAETEAELAEKEALFKRRLRAIYEQGSLSYIDILFGASSFNDFLTRFNNLKLIASNDQVLIDEVRAEKDRIEAMKEELQQEKNRLDGLRRQILASEEEVKRTVSSRQAVRGELQAEIDRASKKIRELEKASAELERKMREQSTGSGGGVLYWPSSPRGYISSAFGMRYHPIYYAWLHHDGIDIATTGYILAADNGRVITVSYDSAFGNYIAIDHQNGLSTIYKHMRSGSMMVSEGQQVTRGQRIGIAGSTGDSTGVHLHFEVLDYNKPPYVHPDRGTLVYYRDPLLYLK